MSAAKIQKKTKANQGNILLESWDEMFNLQQNIKNAQN